MSSHIRFVCWFVSFAKSQIEKNKMDLLWGIGVAAATGAGLFVAAPAVLAAAGFTGAGIAAGSIAAGLQAGIGNVVAGSAFAALQSAGVTGVVSATTGAAASVAAGAVAAAMRWNIYLINMDFFMNFITL